MANITAAVTATVRIVTARMMPLRASPPQKNRPARTACRAEWARLERGSFVDNEFASLPDWFNCNTAEEWLTNPELGKPNGARVTV